jgi:hypothetical protein
MVPSRRSVLRVGLALAGAVAAPGSAPAQQAPPHPDDEFLSLSELLTGHSKLNPELGHRLNASLSDTHADFDAHVSACTAFARAHGLSAAQPLIAALQAQNLQLAAMALAIVSAWYTGVAGDGPQAKVVAYPEALMFRTVQDVLTVPSYCRAAPGYWTARPPES